MRRGVRTIAAVLVILVGQHGAPTQAQRSAEQRALEAGVEGVIYGLPLVLLDLTMRQILNTPGQPAGINQFYHMRRYPNAALENIVRANVDTLYSTAFLDVAKEPVILTVPDTRGRYYLMPMMDAWSDVFATPGKRTTGTGPGSFAIVGPAWHGTLPPGVREIRSPTALVWILGRTQTNGPSDYAAVHAIQNRYTLVPLSSYERPYAAVPHAIDSSVDTKTPPVEQLERMSAASFFSTLARLMKTNPPAPGDGSMLTQLATIGVVPGRPFDESKLAPQVAAALDRSVAVAVAKLQSMSQTSTGLINGWKFPPANIAQFGTDYRLRAYIAFIAFGANLPADAIYPTTYVDAAGRPLNGAYCYRLAFDQGETPPVNAFWSLTMYDAQSFFVDNPIDRYAISSWMPLQRNGDGSLDVYVQHASPGPAHQANWLPAAATDFNVTMRMYWPDLDRLASNGGAWKPPPLLRLPHC